MMPFVAAATMLLLLLCLPRRSSAWTSTTTPTRKSIMFSSGRRLLARRLEPLYSSTDEKQAAADTAVTSRGTEAGEELPYDYEIPDDAVINIKPRAMRRLRELRAQQQQQQLVLRMGVRSGGCSGMSYVMDFSSPEEIREDDAVDEYAQEGILCVVDAKSLLYLYGLELDYSDQLIGGGFKFSNPNAEESCGCGSSFGV